MVSPMGFPHKNNPYTWVAISYRDCYSEFRVQTMRTSAMLNKIKFAIASGTLMLTLSSGSDVALAEPIEVRYNRGSFELIDEQNNIVENVPILEGSTLQINRNILMDENSQHSAMSYEGDGRHELIKLLPTPITQEVGNSNQVKKLYRLAEVRDRQTGEEMTVAIRIEIID